MMKLKRLLCVASLMLMMLLVGCGKKKLDVAALEGDWQFVEMEAAGVVTPHTSGLESKEPAVKFDGESVDFTMSGNLRYGTVEAGEKDYKLTFDDGGRDMTAVLSEDGNTLTLKIDDVGIRIEFTK